MARIAFATCAKLADGFQDDHEAARLLGADFVVWNDPAVDWSQYDHVVIRSAWDYTIQRDEFVAWVRSLGDRVSNQPDLIAFNSDKAYLGALGVPTVPTTYVVPGADAPPLRGEVVVKPTVSAGGRDTGRFDPDHHDEARELIARITGEGRVAMVQPYVEGVDARGETAVVFLDGELSHVLHKKPVLRTQGTQPLLDPDDPSSEAAIMHDDDLVTAAEATPEFLDLAHAAVAELSGRFGTPLYVRVDMVPGPSGPVVMELEAVEPCLYLDLVPGAAERLAAAVRARVGA
ncbi:ATP-grasp domain-containing protein [Aeromicrobium sp. 179-A 4D2 NHS]|uniref:ATP-grasp domain-containing protein n=1 Tax=Aeromicrobium sp. 179-A 4D2 NHS TaxID=3142375 RepID=UPI0039A0AFE5